MTTDKQADSAKCPTCENEELTSEGCRACGWRPPTRETEAPVEPPPDAALAWDSGAFDSNSFWR